MKSMKKASRFFLPALVAAGLAFLAIPAYCQVSAATSAATGFSGAQGPAGFHFVSEMNFVQGSPDAGYLLAGEGKGNGPGAGKGNGPGGGHGPGDGTGNQGTGPKDGTGNGPGTGDCQAT